MKTDGNTSTLAEPEAAAAAAAKAAEEEDGMDRAWLVLQERLGLAQASDDDVESLRKKVEEQRQQIEEQEAKIAALRARPSKPEEGVPNAAGQPS